MSAKNAERLWEQRASARCPLLEGLLKGDTPADGVFRVEVDCGRDALNPLHGDEDICQLVETWLLKGKRGKVVEMLTKGLPMGWPRLYQSGTPRRIRQANLLRM